MPASSTLFKPARDRAYVQHPTPQRDEVRDNVIQFRVGDPDTRRHFDPGCPVPARIAELRAAVMDGTIRSQYAQIAIGELQQLEPDRYGNWRTLKPRTYALIAAQHGCKPRTVKTAFAHLKQRLAWWNWIKCDGGFVLRMGPDGSLKTKEKVRPLDAKSSDPKENQGGRSINKAKNYGRSNWKQRSRAEPAAEPAPIRLARWLALSAEVIEYGISLGLTRPEVLAVAGRFANWYSDHPEREPKDLTAAFCGYRWLQRDAARKQAAAKLRHADADDVGPDVVADDDRDHADLCELADDEEAAWRLRVTGSDDPPPPTRAEIFSSARAYLDQHHTTATNGVRG